jgi:hypothetical protein
MSTKHLLLAALVSIVAFAVIGSNAQVRASTLSSPTRPATGTMATNNVTTVSPSHSSTPDFFPFRSCFTFVFACGGFNFGCFFNCFRTPFFFPFFNRFVNNVFPNANCIQIMRMPNGGTVTIKVC